MATSDKYDVRDVFPFEPYEVTGMVYDKATQEHKEGEGEPIKGYFIHAQDRSRSNRGGSEAPGTELKQTSLDCQIVRSPKGKSLEMPEGVGAAHRFKLTLKGKPGRARILPSPSPQNPEARREVGEIFSALWEAYD